MATNNTFANAFYNGIGTEPKKKDQKTSTKKTGTFSDSFYSAMDAANVPKTSTQPMQAAVVTQDPNLMDLAMETVAPRRDNHDVLHDVAPVQGDATRQYLRGTARENAPDYYIPQYGAPSVGVPEPENAVYRTTPEQYDTKPATGLKRELQDLWSVINPRALAEADRTARALEVERLLDDYIDPEEAAAFGAFRPALSISEAVANSFVRDFGDEESGKRMAEFGQKLDETVKKAKDTQPVAYGAGNLASSLALMRGISSGVSAIPGFENLPALAKGAISGAAARGGTSFIGGIGAASRAEGENQEPSYFPGTDLPIPQEGKAADFAKEVLISSIGGAAGGAAAAGANALGSGLLNRMQNQAYPFSVNPASVLGGNVNKAANALTRFGLEHNTLARAAVAGVSGASFVAGEQNATRGARKLFGMEQEEQSTADIYTERLIGFGFGVLSYLAGVYSNPSIKNAADQGAEAYQEAAEAAASGNESAYAGALAVLNNSADEIAGIVNSGTMPSEEAAQAAEIIRSVVAELNNPTPALPAAEQPEQRAPTLPQYTPIPQQPVNEGLRKLAEEMAAEQIAKTAPPAQEIAPETVPEIPRPVNTTPAPKAPAAATEGPTATPEKKGGNFIARGEKNGLPFDIVVERIPAEKSTIVNDNPAEHTLQEQRVIEEYKNAVDQKLLNWSNRVREAIASGDESAKKMRLVLNPVPDRAIPEIQRITGVDATGFTNMIDGSAVVHIDNRHGVNGEHDNTMREPEDLARVQYVLDNFDSADVAYDKNGNPRLSKQFFDKDNNRAQMIRFAKKVNGTYYVVEAVPDSADKKLHIVSAYMDDNSGSITQALNMNGNPPPQPTPEAPLGPIASAGNSVARDEETVKLAENRQTGAGTIRTALKNSGSINTGGYEYRIMSVGTWDGYEHFVGNIVGVVGREMGGYISNARENIYSTRPQAKDDVIEELIEVAQNNRMLENGSVAPETKPVYNKPKETAPKEGVNNGVESVEEVPDRNGVSEAPVSGPRDGGLLDGVASKNVRQDESGRAKPGGVLRDKGERVRGHADGSDAAGNERGRSLGDREGENLSSAGAVEQAEETPEIEETGEALTVEQQTAQEIKVKDEEAVQEKPRGENYVIPAKGLSLPSGEKARYKANIQAIKTLRTLMADGRLATPEEQEILSKYVGWGGLANAFDSGKSDWAKEFKQLKGLLTDEEYSAAKGSTLNAHYTDIGVIRGMYAGLEKLGFRGGRMLEPSAGVGHFAGAMPENLLPGVKSWTMVELDKVTGNIAKYLYPNADVRVQGFETAKIPDNYMDMAISNVPFGNYGIADKSYPKEVTGSIHNYFFAKSLDKVRPGGLVAFITSRYTMDSSNSAVRRYIMKRADLLGAIRLPETAFKGNAGTEVVTDILILKKREPGTAYNGEAFENADYYHRNLGVYETTNEYFQKHPEMVLGEASSTGSMYRSNSLTYKEKDTRLSLQKQIEKAFSRIDGKMDYPVRETPEKVRKKARAGEGRKNGNIVKRDGKLYRLNDGELEETAFSDKDAKRMEGAIGIRDAGRALLDAQISDQGEGAIKIARHNLNVLYDEFVKENGPLNKPANARLIKNDSDFPFILSLENYDKESKTATKAAIFTKNTVAPNVTVTHTDTAEEALTVCMNETGEVNMKRIAELTGESEDEAKRVLLDGGLVFLNRDGNLETAEQYLSGNVKAKLRDAEALAEGNKDYQRNVDALKKIIPPDVAPDDIAVRLGVTWVPDTIYGDFAAEMLGTSNRGYRPSVSVQYSRQLGQFTVKLQDAWLKNRPENLSTWGTVDRPFTKILEATLNNRNVTVWRKNADGSRILDKQATAAAQEKQEKILAEFQKWIWSDDKRRDDLAKLYNDIFNNTVTPHYDGTHLTVDGANAAKPLRQHQKDAVQRIINSGGNTLLAHRVGAGKTYEMAAAAMKLRQLGIVKKPMFIVPKSLVAQWGNEFLDFFPAAKVLVTGEKDFSAANRKVFANRIATGDYDAVIMSYEQFKAVPMSYESQEAFYQQQIDELEEAIYEAAAKSGKRDPSVKQLEKSKKSLEAKLRKLGDMKKDTGNIDFESLGVDSVFVDEAHNYKNLFYTTNMQNVSGLSGKNGSERAFDLYMKVRYLQKLNGGRGVVFATATPVMNSMAEMYIMQKYLQSDLLEARGLTSFDAWANQFGEVRTVLEMNPSGKGFRQKQSFSRFKNLAELQQMFRSFADVITEIPGLKIPEMKTGKRIIVESEPSEFQMQYIDELAKRADAIKSGSVDPSVDNMLKITSEGRKLSYTQRMIDPSLPYEEGNKIMKAAQNVADIYRESAGNKGTQLIFCDLSTPKGGAAVSETSEAQTTDEAPDAESISIYDDIKNVLVGQGIPANEIAFIHDANSDEKKAKLFADVNEGKVRILIGSTGKMGVGMNAQKRMVALHHLDAPWRPGDIEQREGRALRQGNINDEVGVYVYVTKKTFDSRMWDNLQRKAGFIHQVMAGDLTARESEGDGDFALSAAEIKAISSGNPLIIEQFETAAEITKLEALERAHNKEVADAKKRLTQAKAQIVSDTDLVQRYQKDVAARQDTTGDKFTVTVGGKTYTDRKAAGEAIIAQAKKHLDVGNAEKLTPIGSFAGFELLASSNGDLVMRGAAQYRTSVNMQSAAGTVQSMEAMPRKIDSLLETTQKRLAETESRIGKLEKIAASSFDRADELSTARRRMSEIMAELNPDEDTGAALGDDDDGEDMSIAPEESADRSMNVSQPEKWTAERVGSTDKKPMGLSEIVEKIRHDFGLNITTGHIRGAGVQGQYRPNDQGIRTRIANDLPTVAHELGHHFERVYDITGNMPEAAKKEIVKNLDPEFAAQYKEDKLPREGVAEFLRRFLQNSETAAIDYPEFTKYFLNTISGSDAAQIMELADEVNAYYSMDADTAQSSVRLREEGRPDARTLGEKIKQRYHNFYQAWIDSNHGIKLFEDATGANVYKLATNAAYADARAGAAIIGNLYDRNGAYVAPGLKSCFAGNEKYLTDKALYRTLGEYLIVKHGPERLAEGLRVFADDRKNSTAWMNKRTAELESQHPELKGISERLYGFQKQFLQTWGVDTRLVSQESADEWAERWQYYVPFNRAVPMEARGIGAKRGFANQNSTIKKAVGSGLDIINPVDNIITNIVKMVNAGIRNNVMVVLRNYAKETGDATFLENIPPLVKKKTFDMRGVKAELKNKVDESGITDATEIYGIIDGLDDILEQYGRGKAYGDVVTVLVDGKPEYWKINDPLLLQSITNMAPKKMEGILDAYAQVSRFMTGNITGNNLLWSIFSNFPRDLGTFFVYSKEKNPVRVFASMGNAYVNKVKGDHADPLFMEYLAMGGGSVSAYTADRDLAKRAREKLAGKKIGANPLDWIAFTSDMIEMGPRYATYKLMRENGMTPQEAFYEAMDITVNFRRGGRLARETNKVVPFFNAGVQGLDKFARYITADDAPEADRNKVRRGRMIGFIAVSAALAAAFYFMNNRDDESEKEYQQLSNYTKNSYWLFPVGEGKYFAVPKPRELAVLSSFFETCMEYGIGKNNHALDEFYDYVTDTSLPNVVADLAKGDWQGAIGSLGLIGVGAYLMANRDFLGKPIESAGMQYLEPKDRYNARTSKIAYAIGKAFNVSPQKTDYFFSQVLGGWWKAQKALFPVGGENVDYTLGVQNSYVKDNQYSTDIVNRLYDMAEKSQQAKNSAPGDIEKAIAAKRDDSMTTFYSRYNAVSKNSSGTAARGTRQLVLDMILEYEKAAEAGNYTDAEKAVLDVVRFTGDPATYMPSVMNTVVKDGNDAQHSLSDVQYVEYQTDYLRLYYEIIEDALPAAKNDAERAAIVKHAKATAKDTATARTLGRIGAPQVTNKYAGVSDRNVTIFTGLLDVADDDGSLKQAEVIEAIERMQKRNGLSDADAYALFHSRYDSDKNNPWAK